MTLAAAQVEIKAVEPEAVSPCLRPIHVRKRFARIRVGAVFDLDVSVMKEPRIQVEGAIVGSKAVIGEHEKSGVIVDPLKNFPDYLVLLLIKARNRRAVLVSEGCVV